MISRINFAQTERGLSAEEFACVSDGGSRGLLATMPLPQGCETNVVVDNEQRSPFDRGLDGNRLYTEMFFDSYGDMVRWLPALEESLCSRLRPVRGS